MNKDTRKRSNKDPERIIARLKRDAATDAQAGALLGSVASGEIKPYRAAVAMGWVKPTKVIPIDSARNAVRALAKVFDVQELLAWCSRRSWPRSSRP